MLHTVVCHRGLHCLLRQKRFSAKRIVTFDPLNYIIDHFKFIASIQKEEFISAFKDSADYYIHNYMFMMKYQISYISCELHLQQIMQAAY